MEQEGLNFRIQVLWKGVTVLVQMEKFTMTRSHKLTNVDLLAVVS